LILANLAFSSSRTAVRCRYRCIPPRVQHRPISSCSLIGHRSSTFYPHSQLSHVQHMGEGEGRKKKHTPSGSTAHSRIPRTGSPRDTWKDTRVAVACPAGPINGEERLPVRSRADDRDASRRELLRRRRGVFERSRRAQEPKARGVLERRRPRRCS